MLKTFRKKIITGLRNILFDDIFSSTWLGGNPSESGITVTENSALNLSAVWGAVQFYGKTMGSLPLKVFNNTPEGKEINIKHPLHNILSLRPNPEMTSYTWRSLVMENVLLHGNHYSEIQRNRGGKIVALWPMTPSRVTMYRSEKNNKLYYKVELDGRDDIILSDHQMLHLKGLSMNGLEGISVLSAARETFGLALAGQLSAAKFYKNGSQLSGVLEHPNEMGNEAHERLTKSWEASHQGIPQAHRIAILEEGMKFNPITISPQDAQLLESRKFSKEEIATYFGIPLHKIQNLDKATNNNIEHQSIELVQDAILPYAVNFEQEFQIKLFSESEYGKTYAKFVLQGLLRGDTKTRFEGYHIAKLDGWLSSDDIRRLEDMNDLPDGLGKKYYMPLNYSEVGAKIVVNEETNV